MSFLKHLREAQRIYGFCPCCGDPVRLSDLRVFVRTAPPRTPFDDMDDAFERLSRSEELFKGRERSIREVARTEGQKAMGRAVARIAPFLKTCRVEAQEVKVLFHPVDYIAFPGLVEEKCGSVDLIDSPPSSRQQEVLHRSLDETLRNGRVVWETYRVMESGRVEVEESTRATTFRS